MKSSQLGPDPSVGETIIVIWEYFGGKVSRYSIILRASGEAVWTKMLEDSDQKRLSKLLHHLFWFSELHATCQRYSFYVSCLYSKLPVLLGFLIFFNPRYYFLCLIELSLPSDMVNYNGTCFITFLQLACFTQKLCLRIHHFEEHIFYLVPLRTVKFLTISALESKFSVYFFQEHSQSLKCLFKMAPLVLDFQNLTLKPKSLVRKMHLF